MYAQLFETSILIGSKSLVYETGIFDVKHRTGHTVGVGVSKGVATRTIAAATIAAIQTAPNTAARPFTLPT